MYSIDSNKEYCITLHLVGYTERNTLTMHGTVNVIFSLFFLVYHATNAPYSYFFGHQMNLTGDGVVK
jgi:hypothetical protein